jgi:AraC family transcriptional regulator
MEMTSCIQRAIDFIEDNILDDLKPEIIASQAYMSSFQFQRIFSMVCGISLGDYIRNRRLTLAGIELISSKAKVIDVAYKYGYEAPESFSRAFTRFHEVSPMMARNHGDNINLFAKISVQSILGGKQTMQDLKQRGYSVKENGPVYYTENMDKTAKWFENVLGWYVNIDQRDKDGMGTYGCALPIPGELLDMKITTFNGIHMFWGEPSKQTVAFMRVEGLEELHLFVKKNGWEQITELKTQPWGGKECDVTTIDGSIMRFFQLD